MSSALKKTPPSKVVIKTPAKPASTTVSKPASKPLAKPKTAVVKPVIKVAAKSVIKASVTTQAKPVINAAPKVAAVVIDKVEKPKKIKLVRDSFTLPKNELNVLSDLKLRALSMKVSVKKSELLRAGIKSLAAMNDTAFQEAIKAVPTLKTGRPKK